MNIIKLKRRRFCECGCGEYTKSGNRFLYCHHWKGRKHLEETKKKISNINIGRVVSLETRKKLSETKIGNKNPFFGKTHSPEILRRLSKINKGKKISREIVEKRLKKLIGRSRPDSVKQKLSEANKGKKLSEETKRKISEKMKGKKNSLGVHPSNETRRKLSESKKGEKSYRFGKTWSQEDKERIGRQTRERLIDPRNHPNWKGGISMEPYCFIWSDSDFKKSILQRDNYQCQNSNCWKIGSRIVLHHIDYDKKNCQPSNLITLCNSCNSRANFNREYWKQIYG